MPIREPVYDPRAVVWHEMQPSVHYTRDYLDFTTRFARELPLPEQKPMAVMFTALELNVGHWYGFHHYGLINAEQYSRLAELTPVQTLERKRYADELVAWWKAVGYPFTTCHAGEFYYRQQLLAGHNGVGQRDLMPGHARSQRRANIELQAWAIRFHDGNVAVERAVQDHFARDPRPSQFAEKTDCILPDNRHAGQPCILCAVPRSWHTVAAGCAGHAPDPPGRVHVGPHGRRSKDRESVANGSRWKFGRDFPW